MPVHCHYSVAKFVPDEVRDESINIGVLVQPIGQNQQLLCSFVSNYARVFRLLDSSVEKRNAQQLIEAHALRISESAGNGIFSLDELSQRFSGGSFQITAPRATTTDDLNHELAELRRLFVFEEEGAHREHGFTDNRLRSDVKQVLKHAGITLDHRAIEYRTKGKPVLFKGKRANHQFDLKFSSPTSKVELFRCISFDVDDYSSKLDSVKVLLSDSRDIKLGGPSQAVTVASILRPPQRSFNGHLSAFLEAKELLAEDHIPAFDFSDASQRASVVNIARQFEAEFDKAP